MYHGCSFQLDDTGRFKNVIKHDVDMTHLVKMSVCEENHNVNCYTIKCDIDKSNDLIHNWTSMFICHNMCSTDFHLSLYSFYIDF